MFGLSLLTILLFSYFYNLQQEEMILEVMQTQAKTVARSIELVSADAIVTEDKGIILENNLNILKKSPNIRYIVISPRHGETIVSTKNGWRIQPLSPEMERMQGGTVSYRIIDSSLIPGEKIFHYVYPLSFNGFDWGWLHLGFSVEQINTMRTLLYRKALMITLLVLMITLIGSYAFSKWLTQPIIQLNEAAKSVAKGKLSIRIPTGRKDETGELISNFNTMIRKLRESQMKLRSTNRLLEERVEQRTKDLQKLNEELEERVKREVAKSREKDQMLIQQSRLAAMGEMIGNIAHQWRQPLNAMGLILQNIQLAYTTGRLDAEYLEKTTTKGMKLIDSMSQTIDDFRNFFKPNKSKEVFNVSESIFNALDLIESSMKNHDILIDIDIPSHLNALGYPSEFSQVLLNILNNAKDVLIDRDIETKKIRIDAWTENSNILISIEDNGGGIDPKIMEKIFDPYFTTKEEGKGTGLGLYMSKMIMQRSMNGQLHVTNTPAGAKFFIVIPEAQENRRVSA